MSNTLKEIFDLFSKNGCDPQSVEVQLKASIILRDYILEKSKAKSISLIDSFATAVRQLAWQSPANLFDKTGSDFTLWGDSQHELMTTDLSELGRNFIIFSVAEWVKTEPNSLGPVMEVVTRNFVYFNEKGVFNF